MPIHFQNLYAPVTKEDRKADRESGRQKEVKIFRMRKIGFGSMLRLKKRVKLKVFPL